MKRVILLLLLLVSVEVSAHQANLGGFTLAKTEDGKYTVQLGGSLVGFEVEINHRYSKTAYSTADEFKDLVIKHFKDNVALSINGKLVEFNDLQVMLGHESQVWATVSGVPEKVQSIQLKNTFFQDIPYNKLLVTFNGEDLPSKRYVLNKANNHSLKIVLKDNQQQE